MEVDFDEDKGDKKIEEAEVAKVALPMVFEPLTSHVGGLLKQA